MVIVLQYNMQACNILIKVKKYNTQNHKHQTFIKIIKICTKMITVLGNTFPKFQMK